MCGNKFWHPSRWPWVKVTKVPKRDTIYLVHTILRPLTQSLQLGRYIFILLVSFFFRKIPNPIYPVEHSICHILGMVGPIDAKQKGNESAGWYAGLGTFDLDLWLWIFLVKLYLGNGRPDCRGTKGTGVDRMPWCETQPLCDLEAEKTVRGRGELRCRRFLHDRPWISPWIKSISNELDITIHVIVSQLSRYCEVISNRLWRHHQNEDRTSETRGRCVKIVVFYRHLWIRYGV